MKALEILREQLKVNYNKRPFLFEDKERYHNEKIAFLHEAIDELEALNNKHSCSGCRYEPIKECTECIHCKRFCRDRYDKKHID